MHCVDPPLELPSSESSIIRSINKKHSENLKCEPDVFIKIESAMGGGGRIVNANPNVESETESEESESGSESEESSLPDGEIQDSSTMTEEVPNGLHPDITYAYSILTLTLKHNFSFFHLNRIH